jgi:hypothetical protein
MKRSLVLLCLFTLLLLTTVTAAAAVDNNITWWTVDGGGGTSSFAGKYSLSGSIGQADAGSLSGGGYRLQGGFWGFASGLTAARTIYLPLVIR